MTIVAADTSTARRDVVMTASQIAAMIQQLVASGNSSDPLLGMISSTSPVGLAYYH